MSQENIKNKNPKISISAILGIIKKIPWILGKHAFMVVLLLIILSIVFGVSVFYKYIYSVKISQPNIADSPSTFKSNIYQEILKDWEARDQKLQNGEVPNTF